MWLCILLILLCILCFSLRSIIVSAHVRVLKEDPYMKEGGQSSFTKKEPMNGEVNNLHGRDYFDRCWSTCHARPWEYNCLIITAVTNVGIMFSHHRRNHGSSHARDHQKFFFEDHALTAVTFWDYEGRSSTGEITGVVTPVIKEGNM